MRLLIHKSVTDLTLRSWFLRAFRVCERELGLTSQDAVLQLRITPGYELPHGAGGATNSRIRPGRVIDMIVSSDVIKHLHRRALVVGHEMVHVRQIITGQLVADHKRGGMDWKGKWYPKKKILQLRDLTLAARTVIHSEEFNDLVPWEAEAYPEGERLRDLILKEVSS